MKRTLGLALMLAIVSIPSFAAKNSDNLTISDKVTVGSTQLPPASYKVTWTGTGSDVQVTISNSKTSVTVPAKLADAKNGNTSILTDSKNGATVVQAIYLNKVTLTLANAPAMGQ
jgi:hypothetical protein